MAGDRARTDDGRPIWTLNMDVEVPGHDLNRRIIEYLKLLEGGETFKMTFRGNGQVKDYWFYYADGHWQAEEIKYVSGVAQPTKFDAQ